jgi:hypothetical protein
MFGNRVLTIIRYLTTERERNAFGSDNSYNSSNCNEVYKVGENKGRRGDLTKSARNKSHKGKQSCDESPALHEFMRPLKKIPRSRLAEGEILTDD